MNKKTWHTDFIPDPHFNKKLLLRKKALARLKRSLPKDANVFILESNAGYGKLYEACYRNYTGVAIEKDNRKINPLKRQRPNWQVVNGDNRQIIHQLPSSLFEHINFIDTDPYGSPWLFLTALFERISSERTPDRLHIVCHDGLPLKLRATITDIKFPILRKYIDRYADRFRHEYHQISAEMLTELCQSAQYTVHHFEPEYIDKKRTHLHWLAELILHKKGDFHNDSQSTNR